MAGSAGDGTERWAPTLALEALDPDYPSIFRLGGAELALCRVGDEAFALSDICSHAYAHLSDGWIDGDEIYCPLHQGSFDIRTGAAVASPCFEPVTSYPTRIEDGMVFVDLAAIEDNPPGTG